MSRSDENKNLDRILAEIRDEPVDPGALTAASDRVRLRLGAASSPASMPAENAPVEGCAGYQALLPSYAAGTLSPARVLLVEDHVRECVACRRALREERSPSLVRTPAAPSAVRSSTATAARWAAAAVVVVGLGLTAYAVRDRFLPSPFSATGRVQSVDGELYRLDGGAIRPVAVGEAIAEGEVLRAGRGAGAVVRLADGSQVEMRERSEFSLGRQRDGVSVDLAMGSVILQAAKQGAGHLYVKSDDCLVAVTGTIFTVSHDLKGSKVSVVEGSVEVRFGEEAFHLKPGDQVATSKTLEKTSVESEISWSRNVDQYLALLGELKALRKDLEAQVSRPGLRTSTALLDRVPDGTVFYAAIPNVAASLVEARRVLREKVDQSPTLARWWQEKVAPLGGEAAVDGALEHMRVLGDQLGDEIVVTLQKDESDQVHGPFLLAEAANPDSLRATLEGEIARIGAGEKGSSIARVLTDAEVAGPLPTAKSPSRQMLFWLDDGLLVASPDLGAIRSFAGGKKAATASFAAGSFHSRLADVYRDGACWVFGVDLHGILGSVTGGNEKLRDTGVLDAEHLIVEAKEEDGMMRDQALLTFDQPRRGVASWLAAPGPMGSLRFISPDATLAAAFVVKDPEAMVQDAYGLFRAKDPSFDQHLEELSSKTGIDLARDLAAPLGGEVAFALDGPILPVPAWKLVVEVNDPGRLQETIARLVDRANQSIRSESFGGLRVETETVGARTFYTLRSDRPAVEVHYAFVDGYLLAAPRRALLERAMQQRDSNYDLRSSPKFTALLPRDARTSFSALAYQDLSALTAPLAGMAGNTDALTPEQRNALLALTADSPAGLAYAYAEQDRIVFGGGRSGGVLSILGSLLGLDPPQALPGVFGMLSQARHADGGDPATP